MYTECGVVWCGVVWCVCLCECVSVLDRLCCGVEWSAGHDRLLCVLQLGFESLVPMVTSDGIDGYDIAMCMMDSDDFADLFPTAKPKDTEECYNQLVAYRKKNKKKTKKEKKQKPADSTEQVCST